MSPAYDDRFGMRGFVANARIKHQTQDYSVHYTTNDMDFAEKLPVPEIRGHLPHRDPRLLLIFGSGVNDADLFSEKLQEKLSASFAQPRFEVINLGMMGVSLSLSEYLYRELGRATTTSPLPVSPDVTGSPVSKPTSAPATTTPALLR